MTVEEDQTSSGFRKKVYTKMYHSSISALKASSQKPAKKIIPTPNKASLREEFKKTFLPLLIDVYELRKMIQNYKVKSSTLFMTRSNTKIKSPQEILKHLTQLQQDIEESQKWCDGVILEISKGIKEAKEALEFINPPSDKTSNKYQFEIAPKRKNRGFLDFIFRRKSG